MMDQTCTLLMVTHPGIGSALLHQMQRIFAADTTGQLTKLYLMEIDDDAFGAKLDEDFNHWITTLDETNKVLVLTDLEGATPASLALRHARRHGWPVLTGLNLPMLLKAVTHRHLELSKLIIKVIEGTQDAIHILYEPYQTD